ncbi:MAG: GNAT family N-acetyltransferase [Cytophagales bacterium]|nr:GNAT family N-acetyltransferase [Armatimonadota bacterium]
MELETVFVRQLDLSRETEREALYDLRWRVLREPLGLARGTEQIAADPDPATIHLGAFVAPARLVGCATLVRTGGDLQLRAMAVDPASQGAGVGAAILREAAQVAANANVRRSLWCEARAHAVGFYQRAGWVVESGPFEVPQIGPHYRMRLSLPQPEGPG